MEKVTLTIDNMKVEVPKDYTVLEAAKSVGIDIPTLCFLKDINEVGACRICLVEIEGNRNLQTSCVYPVSEGMVVKTNTEKVRDARKSTLELILSNHNRECLTCNRNRNCELQTLSEELNVTDIPFQGELLETVVDNKSHSIVRDPSKCILCGRCVSVCKDQQKVGILDFTNRGYYTQVGPAFEKTMDETPCIYCGQCIVSCPVGALREKEDIDRVWEALEDPELHVIVQTAPAVRAALGEEFGYPIGTRVTGKMVAALKRLGFDKVFDTDFAADLTIMEEGHELLDRIQNGGVLPMITSCSPGWIRFCEFNYPEFIPNLSTCKSPQQMFGAITKTYYAEKMNLDPEKIVMVSVMPCTAKKFEIGRPDQNAAGVPDVDISITTRELARMIDRVGLNFLSLPDEEFDDPLGRSTGAAVIFGATGGVMEAALRTAVETLTGEELPSPDFEEVRGTQGIKEATYHVAGMDINVAVASGLANAKELLDQVKSGEKNYHFIEIMGCPGGCVNGGGQPKQPASVRNFTDIKALRAKALYAIDEKMPLRKSHENPSVKQLYKEYLENPGSHKAHELLHTTYVKRVVNKI